jgi:hypothetical protein
MSVAGPAPLSVRTSRSIVAGQSPVRQTAADDEPGSGGKRLERLFLGGAVVHHIDAGGDEALTETGTPWQRRGNRLASPPGTAPADGAVDHRTGRQLRGDPPQRPGTVEHPAVAAAGQVRRSDRRRISALVLPHTPTYY